MLNSATPLVLSQASSVLHLYISPIPTLSVFHNNRSVLSLNLSPLPSNPSVTSDETSHTLSYPDSTSLKVSLHAPHFLISVKSSPTTNFINADIPLESSSWFGLGHLMVQHWPLQNGMLELGPFYPFDNGPNGVCTLIDPTVVSTAGAVVSVRHAQCLHVALNATKGFLPPDRPLKWGTGVANFDRKLLPKAGNGNAMLTLQSRRAYDWEHVEHPFLGEEKGPCELQVLIGACPNVKEATKMVLGQIKSELGSRVQPPVNMMRWPIWSTWARYKDKVNQDDVIEFAHDIVRRGLPRSIMGIDDRWSVKYGDLKFDEDKFPDPRAMVDQLHQMGFKVTLWVTPFANLDSDAVSLERQSLRSPDTGSRDQKTLHFVKTKSKSPDLLEQVGDFAWWQPTRVAALDVTNESALDCFVNKLYQLCKEYGIDGYKFDAGEPSFLPKDPIMTHPMKTLDVYTQEWIHKVASKFEWAEVRSGVRGCQNATPMFRMFDKFSTWGLENGLASVLAALLTSGILGYPFCLPDYIAGNAYGDEVPDAELMIRWTQVTSAMPAMQFSIPPWTMGDECETLVIKALGWRENFFWKHIEPCLPSAAQSYTPIIRPMWWEEPNYEGAADICDQFMLGENVVVAPIIWQGGKSRSVFLPSGQWRKVDLNKNFKLSDKAFAGPVWLKDVCVGLSEMPTYIREGKQSH